MSFFSSVKQEKAIPQKPVTLKDVASRLDHLEKIIIPRLKKRINTLEGKREE